jgi:hypothetical protein
MGSLKGMGHAVECTLMVTRSEMRPQTGPAFVRCGVLDAPACLPDGYYEAAFCGHTAFLYRANGCWNVGIPWREFQAARTGSGRPENQSRISAAFPERQ